MYRVFSDVRPEARVFYSPQIDCWVVTHNADFKPVLKDSDRVSATLATRPINSWPHSVRDYLDCLTSDGLPLIGSIPSLDVLWLVSGFDVGIGTGGGAAEIRAQWMTTGAQPHRLDVFHADRFGTHLDEEAALSSIRDVYAPGHAPAARSSGSDARLVRKNVIWPRVHERHQLVLNACCFGCTEQIV